MEWVLIESSITQTQTKKLIPRADQKLDQQLKKPLIVGGHTLIGEWIGSCVVKPSRCIFQVWACMKFSIDGIKSKGSTMKVAFVCVA